jgi:alkylation response protein AidB-like acyl-CoA dehydrogenase
MTDQITDHLESLDDFRQRARAWLAGNLPRRKDGPGPSLDEARLLQARLFDGGFAGIAFPKEYGGAGLTFEHQQVFAEECSGYDYPGVFLVSNGMMAPTLLDHGSEELKRTHIPKMLRGEERWLQLLSEPSGGSDMAAAMTTATRDGDTWLINGSKLWTSSADVADYGICLARTDLDAPKHRGLSMFAVPLKAPGVTIQAVHGSQGGPAHFFQEWFDDVAIPAGNLIGQFNDGWNVAHSLLFHERNATAGLGHGIGLEGGRASNLISSHVSSADLVALAADAGRTGDPALRQLIAKAHVMAMVATHASARISAGMRTGALKGEWGSLLKLGIGVDAPRRAEIALSLSGADGVIWPAAQGEHLGAPGIAWLTARSIAIAGGTNEMQRNIVSERLLGMPREPTTDRDIPFREVLGRRARTA